MLEDIHHGVYHRHNARFPRIRRRQFAFSVFRENLMQSLGLRVLVFVAVALASFSLVRSVTAHQSNASQGPRSGGSACPGDDGGLRLPPGFCATVFADGIGHARHLAVAQNGVVYVNTWSGSYYPPNETPHEGGFLVALQDKSGSGKANVIERFG